MMDTTLRTAASPLTDDEVVARVRAGDTPLFEILMRRHNQRAYRAARAIVRDEAVAEDVLQQAYLNAYLHLDQYQQRAQFTTWLTRIVINVALAHYRGQRAERAGEWLDVESIGDSMDTRTSPPDPEQQAYGAELRQVLEKAVDTLPEPYRLVFMLRDVEGMATAETAASLNIGEEAVKTRLHRARAMMRRAVTGQLGQVAGEAFPFHAPRCDRVVAAVLDRIRQLPR